MATKKKQTAKRIKIKKADFTQVVDSFHQALQDADLGHLQVHSVTLVPKVAAGAAVGPCPPGFVPKTVCVPTAGGGIHCFTTCVPE